MKGLTIMCGICGFNHSTFFDAVTLENMCEAISHRGPDGRGTYISSGVALGHTRLALVDLEHGAQPLIKKANDTEYAIVFNGEIYNHGELRSELESLGWSFQTKCDTEALLLSYIQWGEACLERLRGMFAFAIWEKRTGEIFCARDHFGIKPLYYTQLGDRFIFASEIKSILEHPAYKKKLNLRALSNYMCFQFSAIPETFFSNIFKLPAAHWLKVSPNGKIQMKKYWAPRFSPQSSLSINEAVPMIEEAIRDSTRFHAKADVAVGSLLSGGVDSSYLSCLLKQDDPSAKTFSIGFAESQGAHDEVSQAAAVATAARIENHSRSIAEGQWWDTVEKALWHMDEPIGDPAAISLYMVDELASSKVKAVLSGEGADELFGGYRIYQAPLASRRLKWIPRGALRRAERTLRKMDCRGANYLYRAAFGPRFWYYTNANQMAFSPIERKAVIKSHLVHEPPQSITAPLYAETADLSEETQMQFVDMNLWLVEDILLKSDKMAMAHSLEARVPFLDKRVFDVASMLPTNLRVTNKGTKVALRQAAAKTIPADVAKRDKLGFPVPLDKWMRREKARKILAAAFASDAARTYFDTKILMDMLEDHIEGANNSRRLWIAYAFLTWHRVFFE